MPTITIKTPYDEQPLLLTWTDRQVTASGSETALIHWKSIQSEGLFGMYGHILELEECFFSDLVTALRHRVGPDNYSLDEEAEAQLQREADHERQHPLPKGAVT